jgi:hypothetical protein
MEFPAIPGFSPYNPSLIQACYPQASGTFCKSYSQNSKGATMAIAEYGKIPSKAIANE